MTGYGGKETQTIRAAMDINQRVVPTPPAITNQTQPRKANESRNHYRKGIPKTSQGVSNYGRQRFVTQRFLSYFF